MNRDEFIPILEAASSAGVQPETLRRWVVSESIPVFVAGDRRRHLIRRVDLDRLLEPKLIQSEAAQPVRAR